MRALRPSLRVIWTNKGQANRKIQRIDQSTTTVLQAYESEMLASYTSLDRIAAVPWDDP